MILVAYRHGLRAAEVCSLEWSQVDFALATLHVRRVKSGKPSTHPIRTPPRAHLLDEDDKSPVVVARGNFPRKQRSKYPDRASVLDARIAGNERLQAALADPAEIARPENPMV